MHPPPGIGGLAPSWDDDEGDPMPIDHYPVLEPVPQAPTHSAQTSPFDRISAQLRVMIYGHVIGNEPTVTLTKGRFAKDEGHPPHALLRVSRLVRSEALPLPTIAKTKIVLYVDDDPEVKEEEDGVPALPGSRNAPICLDDD